jgi:hypothetical protein
MPLQLPDDLLDLRQPPLLQGRGKPLDREPPMLRRLQRQVPDAWHQRLML